MSIEGQGHFFTIYFPGYLCLCFTRPRYQVSVNRTLGPLVSISQSNVMNMEIFVKDFSGTALPRILKFGTNIRYDKLYCV